MFLFSFLGLAYNFQENDVYNIRDRMDDLEIFFYCNIFLSENAATSGGRLA